MKINKTAADGTVTTVYDNPVEVLENPTMTMVLEKLAIFSKLKDELNSGEYLIAYDNDGLIVSAIGNSETEEQAKAMAEQIKSQIEAQQARQANRLN